MKLPWYGWRDHPKAFVVQLFVMGLLLISATVLFLSVKTPNVRQTIVASQNDRATLLADIRVSFSLPVSRESFQPKITPEIDGRWHWEDPLVVGRLYRTVVFEPTTPLTPNTTYNVQITGIRGLLSSKSVGEHSFTFTTQPIPSIRDITVGEPHKITDPIIVELDYPSDRAVEYFFQLNPETEIDLSRSANNTTYTIAPKTLLQQGAEYTLTIEREVVQYDNNLQRVLRRSERELVETKKFTTVSPLGITSVEPQGVDILPSTRAIRVTFADDIQQEKSIGYLSITPKPSGEWVWRSSRILEYVFTNQLEFEQTYTLGVQPGLPAQNGSIIESAGTYSFSTVGALELRSISPGSKTTGIARNTAITLRFNQPVDRVSVEKAIAVTPVIAKTIIWKNDATIQLQPTNLLEFSTNYTVTVGAEAISRYGKAIRSNINSSFSTEEKVVVLAVPLDIQDRALSCEVAALKMALAYRGLSISEDQLMSHIGYDPTTRSGAIWGDPDKAFVGDINGSQNSTGYGVHWLPIAKAASNYRAASSHTNLSLQDLTKQIDAGNPIVVWGTHGRAYYDPWTTPEGKTIAAWKGEHARTVIGYKGRGDSPTAIITNDPIAGRLVWRAADFDANWSRLSRAGVIIY